MSKGGYEGAGKEGGFRSSIRDAAAQRVLQEQDAISKGGTMAERTLEAARTDYESRPTDTYAIERYVRELIAQETDLHDAAAQKILDRAFKETQEFRWRRIWGDLEIRKLKRALRPLKAALEADPADAGVKQRHDQAAKAVQQAEIAEFRSRAEAYPTNLEFKYELGRRLYEAGAFKEAISLLQRAQEDPKRRAAVLECLALCFLAIGFSEEAIGVFREAIEASSAGAQEPSLDLRYGLLTALQSKAQNDRDLGAAEEGAGIASAIARQQLDFKDIMERRQALQSLVNELRKARAGG
jgi:tetratricopeptide (TPR) repeat protein